MTEIRRLPDGRHIVALGEGRFSLRDKDGAVISEFTRGAPLYASYGLSEQVCVVERRDAAGKPTVFQADGSVQVAPRDGALMNPMDPSTAADPNVLVWIGDERVRAYGTRAQSDEIKYGTRTPSDEQLDAGGRTDLS